MMKFLRYLFISVLILASESLSATHLMGGEITWECMGNGTYIFSMKLYRDCNGIPFNATTLNLEVHNHPSVNFITLNKTGDNDISPQCTGGGPSISCSGGGNGAVQELIFTSPPITLSGVPPAQGWIYTFDSCCRNGAITNLVNPSGKGFTLRAKMFALGAQNTNPCFDSSPSFSTKPSTIVCAGVPFTYNQLAFDKDGDSLVYSWAQPLDGFSGAFTSSNPAILPFSGSYSFNNPYPNTSHNASNVPATLNPSTGEISFTSFTQGNFVNVVKVSSYRCGQLVAEIFREIQVIVLPCAVNASPTINAPFLDASGNPTFNDTVVAGDLINFKYCGFDTPGQLLTMTVIGDQFGTNFANPNAGCQNPPCAILGPPPLPSISGTDSVCVFFQWQTSCNHLTSSGSCAATSNTYQFLFTIQDDACPTAGLNIGTVSITIVAPEPIESPQIHCVSVIPSGDVILTWDTPIDTVAGFNGYEIFHSPNPTGPFTSIAQINTYTQTNYTHIGANGNSAPQYYYIQSLGCAQGTGSAPIDTVSSIYLTASGSGSTVNLNWNSTHNPLLSSSSTWYRIYREQPIGIWTLIDSTQSLAYVDSISFCDSILSYRVEIDDGLPCTSLSSIDTVALTGGSANFSDFTFSGTCIGDTTQFTYIDLGGNTITNYHWDFGDGDTSNLINPSHFYSSPGNYTVFVNSVTSSGCADSTSKVITINPLPIVDAGVDTTVCAGTSLTLGGAPTGPAGSSYTWSPSASLNDDTLANPTATPTVNPTEYIVIVTDANGCIDRDTVLISINPLPVIVTNNDTSVCIGTCAQLNATGALSYSWSPGATLSDSTISNPVACPVNTTTYMVTGTDANGCIDTASTTITINPLPIVDAGIDTAICIGTPIVIGGAPTGPAGSGYSWSPALSLDDSTLANPTATPLVTTTFIVTVTDLNGCIDSDTVTISINPLPIVDAGVDTSICIGDTIQLNATGAATYTWIPNSNINNPNIANPFVFPTTTSTYFVTGTDTNGCINMDSVIITVNTLPIITTSNDTTVCIGTCTQLNAAGGTNYSWLPGGSLSDSTISNPVACPTNAVTYIVTVTDSNSCIDTASISIGINPLPLIDAGPDLWLCSGDSIQLNVTGGIGYLWTPSLGLNDTTIFNPMASPTDTATYFITGVDINGCSYTDTLQIIVNDEVPIDPGINDTICAGDSIMLGGFPTSPNGTSFSWFPNGGTLDNDTLPNPMAFPTVTTTYYIVATNDTCTAIDSVTITVNQLPIINAGTDIDICIGGSVQLNATGGNSYLWQPGGLLNDSNIFDPIGFPSDTTLFIVIGTDTNGCSANDSVIVNVNPLPNISATGAATNVCLGDTIQLNATGGNSYLWSPSLGLSDTNIANPLAFPLTTTTYIVTGTDANSCSNIDSVTVTVNQLSIVDLSDTVVCIGETLQLIVTGPTGATYLWSPTTDLSNSTIPNPTTSTQVNITYLVTVTDTNGCIDTTSIMVTAEPKPIANFTVEVTPSCEGISAEFTNLSIGASIYLWNFNDGNQSSEINPIHIFDYGSSATVLLTSFSSGLCIDTSSYPITSGKFEDYFNLTPPTILTPNGDGINDLFRLDVPNEISQCTNIQVFNRWGKKVYESRELASNGWDGKTSSGKKVPDGTYFYIIDVNGITKKGSLTLMK